MIWVSVNANIATLIFRRKLSWKLPYSRKEIQLTNFRFTNHVIISSHQDFYLTNIIYHIIQANNYPSESCVASSLLNFIIKNAACIKWLVSEKFIKTKKMASEVDVF